MEKILQGWDGEAVVIRHDQPTGAWIIIAVHSSRLGPAAGGTRMKPYPEVSAALQDALRLAEGMTYKFAGPGMARGGAKCVIALPYDFDRQMRSGLLLRYGALVKQLGGYFSTGPDSGTSAEDMDIIAETGAPYIFGRTPSAGGAGASGPATAWGVFHGIQTACQHLFGVESVQGRSVLVQGAGSVGQPLIDQLLESGAEVSFSDVDENTIQHMRDVRGLPFIKPDAIYSFDCDIFSPNALGGVLHAETIPQLRCKAIVGGANNQLATVQDAERLRARGILYAPDYVVNVGGAIYLIGVEADGMTPEYAMQHIAKTVGNALNSIFELARAEGITTEAAARRLAEERLKTDTDS